MKKFILCAMTLCIGAIIFPAKTGWGEENSERVGILQAIAIEPPAKEVFVPKDPMIAGLLSVQLPGLGQIYCRRYLRGLTYITSEIGCFILAGTMAGLETRIYSWNAKNEDTGEERKLTQKVTISRWDELSGLERAGIVGLIFGGVGLHIWNVIDAYNLAQEHNQRLGWLGNIDVKLGFKESDPLLELAVFKKF